MEIDLPDATRLTFSRPGDTHRTTVGEVIRYGCSAGDQYFAVGTFSPIGDFVGWRVVRGATAEDALKTLYCRMPWMMPDGGYEDDEAPTLFPVRLTGVAL